MNSSHYLLFTFPEGGRIKVIIPLQIYKYHLYFSGFCHFFRPSSELFLMQSSQNDKVTIRKNAQFEHPYGLPFNSMVDIS